MYMYNQSIPREIILMLQWIQNKVNKNCRTVIKTPPAIEHSLQNTFVPVATIIGSFFFFKNKSDSLYRIFEVVHYMFKPVHFLS